MTDQVPLADVINLLWRQGQKRVENNQAKTKDGAAEPTWPTPADPPTVITRPEHRPKVQGT